MSTYLVKCPQFGCGWSGELAPSGVAEAWSVFEPVVAFECPCCEQEWRARVVGDRVRSLPDWGPVRWPPLEIGVGD